MLECGMVKSNRTISLMGEIFYDLRTQRNFRLTDFEKVGLSKSSLSDFESGKSILRFDKLDAALELMHIEVSEFEYFFNNYHSDYFVEICDEIEDANYMQDTVKLKAINSEAGKYDNEQGNRMIFLATQNLLYGLTEREEVEVTDLMFNIEVWSYFELSILSFVVEHLNTRLTLSLMKDFWKENLHYLKVKKYWEKIVQIVCRAAVKYISENKYSIAQKLLEDVNIALIPYKKDLFCRNMSRFTLGLLLHQSGKTVDGKAKMESSIRLFDELGLPEMKAYYQKIFDESVKN